MQIRLANHSTYPRVGEGAHAQRLRRAYADRETGKVDDVGWYEIAKSYVAEVIAEQEAAGLDVVTDGLVYAYDVVSHPASRLQNVKIGGLVRFFDTNTYVRQPEVTDTPQGSFGLSSDFTRAKELATQQLKQVVIGPYTLAKHSITGGNGDFHRVALGYADALAADLAELAKEGAKLVQIDEPSLLRNPEDAEMVRNLLERATANKRGVKIALTTFFGDASPIYAELIKMPVDVIGFDLIYGPGIVDLLVATPPGKSIALGAIDGRNTKPDDITAIADTVKRLTDVLEGKGTDEIFVQPSCGLEFLPRDRAKRKLESMATLKQAVGT
jgi:5-methyltetrahydropteroyltriglutamate--homocysteine methyltransferase